MRKWVFGVQKSEKVTSRVFLKIGRYGDDKYANLSEWQNAPQESFGRKTEGFLEHFVLRGKYIFEIRKRNFHIGMHENNEKHSFYFDLRILLPKQTHLLDVHCTVLKVVLTA
jgi:hypothetical protein